MGKLAVGLAADCDSPERDVEELVAKNLAGANMLPFAGFVTHDLRWVAGFSGYRDASAFLKVLEAAENSPLLNATDAARKRLAALSERAGKAAEREDWKTVLKAWKEAEDLPGRCPERTALDGVRDRARAWAEDRLAGVVKAARGEGDPVEARRVLLEVKRQFAGEREYEDAENGLKALQRLQGIRKIESGEVAASPEGLRARAAADYEGTRWEEIFAEDAENAKAPKDAGEEGADPPAGR